MIGSLCVICMIYADIFLLICINFGIKHLTEERKLQIVGCLCDTIINCVEDNLCGE